jgi:CubicO group peptidase (beta-lactamase class C family)
MEAGLNARAIDFAKLGRLFLEQGSRDGRQVISPEWVAESTGLDASNRSEDYYSHGFGPWV